jgi:hypothetical protein
MAEPLFSVLDHIVYATPDIEATTDRIASLFGVRPAAGGKHPAWETMNALLSLGPKMYLEIVGPNPARPGPVDGRPFNLDNPMKPRLVTWAVRGRNLRGLVDAAWSEGVDLGEIREGNRRRPDGVTLRWSMTDILKDRENGIVPFFIDWGDSPHPAESAPKGCILRRLKTVHPEATRLTGILKHLGLDLDVERGPSAKLKATIETPMGLVDIE